VSSVLAFQAVKGMPPWIAEHIAQTAAAALLGELETWPKPGLVSYVDAGSHTDMDANTFVASAAALFPFYEQLATAGASDPTMDQLRAIGRRAEAAMFEATGGVNTHRGAIFALGLLCAAAGAAWRESGIGIARWPAHALVKTVRERWGQAIEQAPLLQHTHGAVALREHGAGGARMQAALGFPHAINVGLPALHRGRHLAPDDSQAPRVHAFFALMSSMADTNLLYRGGVIGLQFAQSAARGFLARGGVAQPAWQDQAASIHSEFVARRLSPGGCGDLLAITLFLDALQS